jgi:hypothetical protein
MRPIGVEENVFNGGSCMGLKALPLFDGDEYSHLDAAAGEHLRPLLERGFKELAEAGFCVIDLPGNESLLSDSHITSHMTRSMIILIADYSLDDICKQVHNRSVAWEVEFTDEFFEWWDGLTVAAQTDVDATVVVLREFGPALTRPLADTVRNSRFANMRERRVQHGGRPYRILYAFDPRRTAILLLGGDKTGIRAGMTNTFPRRTQSTRNISGKSASNSRGEERWHGISENLKRRCRQKHGYGRP